MIRSLLRIAALALVSSTALPTNANAASVVYPVGIVTGASNHGVYSALDTAGCCWLARSASFLVRAPAHGNLLLLTIEIPPYALENAPAAFDIRIGSVPAVHLFGDRLGALEPGNGRH